MNILALTGIAAGVAGCACLYLASPNQRWRARPLPKVPARVAAVALIVVAWLCLVQDMQVLAASFVLITLLMLALSVLPYAGAMWGTGRGR